MKGYTGKGGGKFLFNSFFSITGGLKEIVNGISNANGKFPGNASGAAFWGYVCGNALYISIKTFSFKVKSRFLKFHDGFAFRTWFVFFYPSQK